MRDRRALPEISWQPLPWPAGGTDPFDPASAQTCWLAARSAGLSRAFPAGDWLDWGSLGDFERAMPVGYSVLQGLERLAVCLDGEVAREWQPTATPPRLPRPRPALHEVAHLEHADPHWWVRFDAIDPYEAALSRAIELSREGARRAAVVRTLRLIDWH